MAGTQPTRAERKAARAVEITAQRTKKESLRLEAERSANSRNTKKNLLIFGVLTVSMLGLAFGLNTVGTNVAANKAATVELVLSNYQVEDAETARNRVFLGNAVTVSAAGKVHTCQGIIDDDLRAKKPITCDDGAVLQPKP
jgi:hypothetical protein